MGVRVLTATADARRWKRHDYTLWILIQVCERVSDRKTEQRREMRVRTPRGAARVQIGRHRSYLPV